MSRISRDVLTVAVQKVLAMNLQQKEQLVHEIMLMQPHMLSLFLAQHGLGVSLKKMDFLLDLLLVCFQSMKESGLMWPLITEEEQERQRVRYTAMTRFGEGLGGDLWDAFIQQFAESHPEQHLLAFITKEINNWLECVTPEETDSHLIMAAMNYVNCIAFCSLDGPAPVRH